MKHILFIDPLEKLTIKKDSTLLLALSLKEKGEEVFLLFEKDFYLDNKKEKQSYELYDFKGEFLDDGIYLKSFSVTDKKILELNAGDLFHMRIDPPFDTRYLRYLWMQRFLKKSGVKVLNDPDGILLFNEKIYAYENEKSLPSFIGADYENFLEFTKSIKVENLIFKPLDLYQGIGVKKVSMNDENLEGIFHEMIETYKGPVVVQPYDESVESGEIRSLYFKGVEIGSILKTPQEGEFLANIARGASFKKVELTNSLKKTLGEICDELMEYGVDWVAFDVLGENVSEVNITCHGLLVEVSKAYEENLANKIINLI